MDILPLLPLLIKLNISAMLNPNTTPAIYPRINTSVADPNKRMHQLKVAC